MHHACTMCAPASLVFIFFRPNLCYAHPCALSFFTFRLQVPIGDCMSDCSKIYCFCLGVSLGGVSGGGGAVLVCPPPPSRVLKDSCAGAMAPTALNFLLHAWLKGVL